MRTLIFSSLVLVGMGAGLVSYPSGATVSQAQAPPAVAIAKPATDHELPSIALPEAVRGNAGAFIKVRAETNGSEVRWVAMTPGLNVFPGELLKDSTVTVVTASRDGTYVLMAYTALHDVPSDPAYTTVTVGVVPPGPGPQPPPGPDPDPEPSPEVPDDRFDNVGRFTAESVAKLSPAARAHAPATAKLYRTAADKLEDGTLINATAAVAFLKAERAKAWGAQVAEWEAGFVAPVGERFNKHWPLQKLEVVEFYDAVATGLEAVK